MKAGRLDDDGGRYEGNSTKGFWDGGIKARGGGVYSILRLAQQRSRFMVRENGRWRRVVGGCRLRN